MKIESRAKLVELMRHLELPLVGAEIGVAGGVWATELLWLGIEKIYLVDIWETMPFIDGCAGWPQEWHDKNYEQVNKLFGDDPRVVIMKGFSHKMAKLIPDESLGMVYLDASHDKNSVMLDLETWTPKVVKGGIVAGHDFLNPGYGVNAAVQEYTRNEVEVNVLELNEGINNAGFYFIKSNEV